MPHATDRLAGASAAVALALAAACSRGDAGYDLALAGGDVEVRWQSADTISMALEEPGLARWCAEGRWLELSAVSGDTGVMIAVFPADSLAAGSYAVALPARTDSLQARPGATVGLRWFTPGAVAGYRGWEGTVALTRVSSAAGSGRVSGTFEATAIPVAGDGSLAVEGGFSDVPVTAADSGCGAGR